VEVIRIESGSLEETEKIAVLLATLVDCGDVICLNGDLGAGKTTFTQQFAKGLGVSKKEYVTSPSFAIMHEYSCRIPLYHFDFYRLGSSDEIVELGFEDFFYGNGVCVLEWSDMIREFLPEDRLEILIEYQAEFSRVFSFSCYGELWPDRMGKIVDAMKSR